MSVELYRVDPYRTDFVAIVVDRDGDGVVLDQTCFCPGAERVMLSDQGWLGQRRVVRVERLGGGRLVHHVAPGAVGPELEPGAPVVGRVDWSRRYQGMRLHTAFHLIDLALRETHGADSVVVRSLNERGLTVGVVLDGGRLDGGRLDSRAVREWVSSVVREDLPMSVSPPSELFGGPMWHLDGIGHRRCSAPHVSSTGEVGAVNITLGECESAQLRLRVEIGSFGGETGRDQPDVSNFRHRSYGGPFGGR